MVGFSDTTQTKTAPEPATSLLLFGGGAVVLQCGGSCAPFAYSASSIGVPHVGAPTARMPGEQSLEEASE